jgi:hypothetical protein
MVMPSKGIVKSDSTTHKDSRFGIASIIIFFIFCVLAYIRLLLSSLFMNEGLRDFITGTSVILLVIGAATGLIIGVIGVFQKNRNKLFSIIGIVLNTLFLTMIAAIKIINLIRIR